MIPSSVFNRLAELRCEVADEEGSTADEGAPAKGSGWRGTGPPMQVASGYVRKMSHSGVTQVTRHGAASFSEGVGSLDRLTSLALGHVKESPFVPDAVKELKEEVIRTLTAEGFMLHREPRDRVSTPIDFRFLALLLKVAGDSGVSLGGFSSRVRSATRSTTSVTSGAVPKEEKMASSRARQPQGTRRRTPRQ